MVSLSMQAVSDWPACAFAKELIEAYPEAKVILTNRDVDSWHKYLPPSFCIRRGKIEVAYLVLQIDHADSLLACH